jgi:hypothetical protein
MWTFMAVVVPLVSVGCFGTEVPPTKNENPIEATKATAAPTPVVQNDKPGDRMASKPDDELTDKQLKRGVRQAANCGGVSAKGPFGDATVHILVKPNGDVDADTDPPFKGTPIGECLQHSFDREKVPPWNGNPVKKDFTIKVTKSADTMPDIPASATTSTPAKPPK